MLDRRIIDCSRGVVKRHSFCDEILMARGLPNIHSVNTLHPHPTSPSRGRDFFAPLPLREGLGEGGSQSRLLH